MSPDIKAADVKALRERTGAAMMDCKSALTEADGDMDKAIELLRVKGQASAAKRCGRSTSEGIVTSYVHATGKIGALVEIQCETDFVARNDDFKAFAADVALHIAAAAPRYVSAEDVPADEEASERAVFEQKAAEEGKPENVRERIVEGQLAKWRKEIALLEQVARQRRQARRQDDRTAPRGSRLQDRREHPNRPFRPLRGRGGVTAPAPATMGSAEGSDRVFDRIMLKLSGEALMGDLDYGTDHDRVQRIAGQVTHVRSSGVEIAIVVGAGNIYRGLQGAAAGMDRATADYMGMLATVLNALTLQDALEKQGTDTRVMSAIEVSEVAEPYIRRRAMRHLEKGRVVIFAAGTGNPFFTTDTAASLRALEIHAEAILMAKHGVEGVFDADPAEVPDAEFLPTITHREAIERGLKVMDSTALSLCMDNDLPIHVFNMADESNIDRIVRGERVGTVVSSKREEQGS